MKTITHEQAQGWVQARLDHTLSETDRARLEAHLQGCPACRRFASHLGGVDRRLREYYRSPARSMPRSSAPHQMARAIHRLDTHMRLKMKLRQIRSITNAIAFSAAMVILAIGFSYLVSTRGGQILPAGGRTIVASPTPSPWTEDNPLTNPVQIEATLNKLADQNLAAFQQAEWVHIRRMDLGEAGMLQSSYSDGWYRYPKNDDTCLERLDFVRDRPETSTDFIQILVGLPDGSFGDLIQLRSGKGQVNRLEPGTSGCSLAAEFTSAGEFAARLGKERAATQDGKVEVKAWYATLDGRAVFTISGTFTQPSKANATGIMKETRSFDLETGVLVQEGMRMEWQDGSLFGESRQGYETGFFSELPVDVAAQYEQLSAEIRAYADGSGLQPTAVPEGIKKLSNNPAYQEEILLSLNTQAYSAENPLTDGQAILQILQALKQRQIERLSEPGWYVYGPNLPDPDDWMLNRYLLTHTLDTTGACEYMSYYLKDGVILPQEIVLSDGRWGLIGVVEGGEVSMGETGKINWSNGPATETCQVQNTETVSFIQNEADYFEDLVDGRMQGTYKAWTEEIGGRKFLVLYYDLAVNGQGTVMDPETRKLEPIDHDQSWVYFDLEWGTVLFEAGEQVFSLQNGKTIGAAPSADKTVEVGYTYYEQLPADLAEVYEKTAARLMEYLENK